MKVYPANSLQDKPSPEKGGTFTSLSMKTEILIYISSIDILYIFTICEDVTVATHVSGNCYGHVCQVDIILRIHEIFFFH